MQWIIALLAALACVALGMGAARKLGEREASIRAWDRALLQMEGAVDAGGMVLPDILRAGKLPWLEAAARSLEENPNLSAEKWLDGLPLPDALTRTEWQTVQDGLTGLFSPSPAVQLQAVAYARRQWALYEETARSSAEKNIRLYRNLGWLAGAAVFILMC